METHLKITVTSFGILRKYLLCHEVDIFNDMNDFGELKPVFIDIIGRSPEA